MNSSNSPKENLMAMAGKLVFMDGTYHPSQEMLVEVYLSEGEDGYYDERIVYILGHGTGEYSVFADMNDLMGYLGEHKYDTDWKLCELTKEEYDRLT